MSGPDQMRHVVVFRRWMDNVREESCSGRGLERGTFPYPDRFEGLRIRVS